MLKSHLILLTTVYTIIAAYSPDVTGTWPQTLFPLNGQTVISNPDFATTSRTVQYTTASVQGSTGGFWFQRHFPTTVTEIQRTLMTYIYHEPLVGPVETSTSTETRWVTDCTSTVTVTASRTVFAPVATITMVAPLTTEILIMPTSIIPCPNFTTVILPVPTTITVSDPTVDEQTTVTRSVLRMEPIVPIYTPPSITQLIPTITSFIMVPEQEIVTTTVTEPTTVTATVTSTLVTLVPVIHSEPNQNNTDEIYQVEALAIFVELAASVRTLVPRGTSNKDASILVSLISKALQETLKHNFENDTLSVTTKDFDVSQIVNSISDETMRRILVDRNLQGLVIRGVSLDSLFQATLANIRKRLVYLLTEMGKEKTTKIAGETIRIRGGRLVKAIGLGKALFSE